MHPVVLPTPPHIAALDRLGDEIAELSAHLDAATARWLTLLREFDARGGWANGFRSCADWLSWRVGLEPGAARERVRVARALGELSYSKVRALTRVATPETEARLVAVGRAGTAAHVERIVRGWRRVDRLGEGREAAARHWRRGLQVYPDEDGMVVVRGRLEPEVGAVLLRALEAARAALSPRARTADADPPTHGQQQADALALIAETALRHGLEPTPGSERYQVVVHVDAPVLADPGEAGQSVLEDGVHVPAAMPSSRLCGLRGPTWSESASRLRDCARRGLPRTAHSRDASSGLIGRKGALHDGSRLVDTRRSRRGLPAAPATNTRSP